MPDSGRRPAAFDACHGPIITALALRVGRLTVELRSAVDATDGDWSARARWDKRPTKPKGAADAR